MHRELKCVVNTGCHVAGRDSEHAEEEGSNPHAGAPYVRLDSDKRLDTCYWPLLVELRPWRSLERIDRALITLWAGDVRDGGLLRYPMAKKCCKPLAPSPIPPAPCDHNG